LTGTCQRPIIDAGPGLNFFSINRERLLIGTLGPLSAPECVRDEVRRKAARDARFRASEKVLSKLSEKWLHWLPDDATAQLASTVHRISGMPIADRLLQSKDLGETMVVAHAVVAAEAGADVTVLIDEHDGAALATAEARRLDRQRIQGHKAGSITLINTVTVLEKAAGSIHIPDRNEMRDIYTRMRGLDDGLVPIERTPLLDQQLWT
jgi:hypothetical protein